MILGFSDVYSFIGFITSIIYNLIPCVFLFQLKHKALKKERISIIPLLCLYSNGILYFSVSAFQVENMTSINPMDFCNLVGAYLGLVYLIIYIVMVYLKEEKRKVVVYITILVIMSILFLILVYNVIEISFWIYLFKYLGIVFNILQNLPMGFSIIYLIKYKVSEKYTLFGAFFGFLNILAWFVWGFQAVFIDKNNENKPYQTVIANLIALLLPIMQFYLYYKFKKDDDDDISNSSEIENDNLEPIDINHRNTNQEILKNQNINRQSEEFEDFI